MCQGRSDPRMQSALYVQLAVGTPHRSISEQYPGVKCEARTESIGLTRVGAMATAAALPGVVQQLSASVVQLRKGVSTH